MNTKKTSKLAALAACALVLSAATSVQAQVYDHIQCFKIKDTKTFKKATADITVPAGLLAGMENCIITGGAKEYCVPVDKMNVVVTEGTETPVAGQPHGYDRLCYKLKCPTVPPAAASFSDQFGLHSLTKLKAATICTPAVYGTLPSEAPPTWPSDPASYTPGPTSYIDTLTLPPLDMNGAPTCCKDFGAKSKPNMANSTADMDNALAKLADSLSLLGLDVQQTLDDALTSGQLVMLLDHQDLDLVTQPDEFTLVQMLGAFEGSTDYTLASQGLGTFLASQDSFVPGSGEPRNWFHPADMGTTAMSAEPFTLTLTLPFGFLSLSVKAAEASVAADHGTISAGGVTYTNGELSGYALMDELFGQLNAILNAPACACLMLTGDVYSKPPGGPWISNCVAGAGSLCSNPGEEVCATLAGTDLFGSPPQVCAALPDILQDSADIDLNSDPTVYEAMSVGLQFTAVNGQIVGIQP